MAFVPKAFTRRLPCSRQNRLQKSSKLRGWGPTLRISIGLAALAFALAGFGGEAAAQYYPPLSSGDYYPGAPSYPPPRYGYGNAPPYAPPNGPYAPYAYRDANGMLVQPFDPYNEPTYPPPYAPQPRPYYGGEQFPRPPAGVSAQPPSYGAEAPDRGAMMAALPPDDQPESGPVKEMPANLRRQLVSYPTPEPAGTVIIDTPHTYLYLVLGNGTALRYGIGVGREGFTWSGTERISRMTEWPDWHPPKEMIERQPYLPRFMAGGAGNPLGARALYLGDTLYRIHGTNQPSTIGHFVSSGCIRLTNEDIEDLYNRISIGSRVVVLPGSAAANRAAVAR
jgi:lipoprotein-anchoring transpeptidase ErfK/SrfK